MEHGLYEKIQVPGKKKAVLLKHFDQVPFGVLSVRAEGDANLHYRVGMDQVSTLVLATDGGDSYSSSLQKTSQNEINLTPVLFKMERWGIKINPDYTRRALHYEETKVLEAKKEFHDATGILFS